MNNNIVQLLNTNIEFDVNGIFHSIIFLLFINFLLIGITFISYLLLAIKNKETPIENEFLIKTINNKFQTSININFLSGLIGLFLFLIYNSNIEINQIGLCLYLILYFISLFVFVGNLLNIFNFKKFI